MLGPIFISDIEFIGADHNSESQKYVVDKSIYLKKNDEILKLNCGFKYMDIVDCLEEYIMHSDVYNFKVMSEENIKSYYGIKLSYFPFVGKYKLKNNLKKTNNYFVPEHTRLLELLINLYKNIANLSMNDVIKRLNYEYTIAQKENDIYKLNIIKKICSCISFKLIERLNEDALVKTIEYANNLVSKEELVKLRNILESSGENNIYFENLDLNDKVDEALNLTQDKKNKSI